MGLTLHQEPPARTSSRTTNVGATTAARRHDRRSALANKVVVPVRYQAWLEGDMGEALLATLRDLLDGVNGLGVARLPRAVLVEGQEEAGPLLETCHRAALALEDRIAARYPVLHAQMGPVWTGTLQAVFA